ncbi:MAG: cysteine--tRNA ligase [Verrucomicrobiota bacterium]|nr:cysteine--tRNA ligase [Verrucomicrobiota bacterium]
MRLFDTLSREVRELQPAQADGTYRMYCCGPTVYGPAHIGNFRTFLMQDVLRRTLEAGGMKVLHVRNLTDVDDKTIRRSMQEGKSLQAFTQAWTQQFHADCDALNLLRPQVEPAATEHIPQQIALIQKLLDNGHAYAGADGSIYFKVESFEGYGKLSHIDHQHLQTQNTNSAGEANDADEYDRESARDFALWKAHKPEDGPNSWPAEYNLQDGRVHKVAGRPGWHIECSAMSMQYLGEGFDLHGGGEDLCFPHHENEIAQSEGATGCAPFSRHWFHGSHLMVDGKKMSKSLGNLYTLEEIKAKGYTANELRYALISGHYRQQLNFTFNTMDAARSGLQKLEKFAVQVLGDPAKLPELGAKAVTIESWTTFGGAWEALIEDLNTSTAFGQIFKTINSLSLSGPSPEIARELGNLLFALGLKLTVPTDKPKVEIPAEIEALAAARWAAKQAKNWAESDRLRKEIEAAGFKILDRKDGYGVDKV